MDPWVCTACAHSVHARCFGPAACECTCLAPATQPPLTPEHRIELRQIANSSLPTLHLSDRERAYITGLLTHRSQRQEAEARRA